MDWNNTNVLEFIELLQNEPAIWDFRKKSHKNRIMVYESWKRIQDAFSVECSIEELKKKRNSLMAAYRDLKRKVKDSYVSGSDANDVYQPTWFAFEAMHSFLGPLYEHHNIINTEEQATILSIESDMDSENETQYKRCKKRKKTKSTNDLLELDVKPSDEGYSIVQESNIQEQTVENELFGQLVAQKLRKFNEDDRLMLTHDIHNLIFKYEMKARSQLRSKLQTVSNTKVWLTDS